MFGNSIQVSGNKKLVFGNNIIWICNEYFNLNDRNVYVCLHYADYIKMNLIKTSRVQKICFCFRKQIFCFKKIWCCFQKQFFVFVFNKFLIVCAVNEMIFCFVLIIKQFYYKFNYYLTLYMILRYLQIDEAYFQNIHF